MKRLEVIEDIKEPIEETAVKVGAAVEATTVVAKKVYKPTRKIFKSAKKGVKIGVKPLKSGLNNINPLTKKVDMNTTTDTGTESIRFAYQTTKKSEKAVKTTAKTVKTAVKTVKTVPKVVNAVAHPKRTAVKVVKNTGRKIRKTVERTAQTVKFVAKVGYTAVAVLTNPYVLIALGIILVLFFFLTLINSLLVLIGGSTQGTVAVSEPIALSDMNEQYKDALDYYKKALADRKQFYYDTIDNLKIFNNNDEIRKSDLVSAEFHTTGNKRDWSKYYATNENKIKLKNEWDYQISDSDKNMLIAIAYCYNEKKLNEKKGTELELYEFDFEQDLFDELLEIIVPLEETITEHQECPNRDCIKSPKKYQEWQEEDKLVGLAVRGYNEWVLEIQPYLRDHGYNADWANWRVFINWVSVFKEVFPNEPYFLNNGENYRLEIGAIYEQHRDKANELREEYENSSDCAEEHELHHIKVTYNNTDELMDLLGFNDEYKDWAKIIKLGFDGIETELEN